MIRAADLHLQISLKMLTPSLSFPPLSHRFASLSSFNLRAVQTESFDLLSLEFLYSSHSPYLAYERPVIQAILVSNVHQLRRGTSFLKSY